MARRAPQKKSARVDSTKPDPDARETEPSPESTNRAHPFPRGSVDTVPGAGIVERDADVSAHDGGPGRIAPHARGVAPGAQRPGATEGRAASAARGEAGGGLGEIEAPSAQGQTAFSPATGGTGAPEPGSSGIRATADPNFSAQSADEEGTPSREALAEQAASRGKKTRKPRGH